MDAAVVNIVMMVLAVAAQGTGVLLLICAWGLTRD